MDEIFRTLGGVSRVIQAAPTAARLMTAVREARQGNPEALGYLRERGWRDGLEAVQPGLGDAAGALFYHAKAARRDVDLALGREIIEGEWREVTSYPWDKLFRYLDRIRWGSFAVLGPRGMGKTALATRLAEKWRERTGYVVETVGMYPGDRPEWAQGVLPDTFVKRAARLVEAINAVDTDGVIVDPIDEEWTDESDEDEAETPKRRRPRKPLSVEQAEKLLASYSGRIVIFDEMGANLKRGSMSALRHAVMTLFNQARHVNWIILYAAQSSKQIPEELLNGQGVFVAKPLGKEAGTDRDRSVTRDIWLNAMEAFDHLREQPGYAELTDPRAWKYVEIADLGGGRPWAGLAPFKMPGADETFEPEWVEVDDAAG